MNYVHIVGRLGRDPETRFTSDGTKVATLVVATSVRKGGSEVTIWWRVSIWGDRWDKMMPHLTKGKLVMIGGELSNKPEIYKDKNGEMQVSSLEIRAEYVRFVPSSGKGDEQQGGGKETSQRSNSYAASSVDSGMGEHDMDDEPLPF